MARLVEIAQEISLVRTLEPLMAIVRTAARELTGADGATFVLRDGDLCHYADEDAIAPLWKGRRFPMRTCISGWVMLNRQPACIRDIYADERIPADAYRPTFVKSLAMVPIRSSAPLGAIGNYWATPHAPTEDELRLLSALADLASVAMENIDLYAQLQQRIAEAQEAVRVRDEFLCVASHELRTPLTVLELQLDVLGESLVDHAGLAGSVERARRSARRLSRLVEELLEASALGQSGSIELVRGEHDLADIVGAVLDRLGLAARRAGCELRLEAERPLVGSYDRARIEQLVTNLVANAITHGAGKPIVVRVGCVERQCEIAVRDAGAGIAPADAERIFERFERAVSVRHYGGLGLGLYLARRIAEAHGGSIRVESEPGHGSTFTVRLPR